MEILKTLIEPQFLTLLTIAVAARYIIGAVNGEHVSTSSADEDGDAGGADRR